VDVAKGGHLFVAVDDLCFGGAGYDLAEDAVVAHGVLDPCEAGEDVDEAGFQHEV
jgi:hypothetical protein